MKERLVSIRKELKKNQTQFAEGLGLTQNFWSLVEKGTRCVSDRTITDICRVYGVNEEWLRTGSGEMFAPKDREQEIADIVNKAMKESDEDTKNKLEKFLQVLTPIEIVVFGDIAKKFVSVMQEKAPDDSEAT